ncbi:MAG: hypothetical protein JJ863_35595 [Deltaproteobacteria bacterium]|nr:hypothetical protein [Deltaproteobacteria bacterium]
MDWPNELLVPLSLALLAACSQPAAPAPEPEVPERTAPAEATLWVWHGATDLRGLAEASEGRVGVAYLARTVIIRRGGLFVRPRRSPLHLDEATRRSAVVRIEVEPDVSADAVDVDALIAEIAPVLEDRASGLQIDFDAPASFRASYAELLRGLKERLPEGWVLEMTALGSWCLQDRWLAEVPVDRVVPMLFGPGHERELTFAALREGPLPEARCRASHGIREGQRTPRMPDRLYLFPSDGPWTVERAMAALDAQRS